jgi:RNA recognition motif-containing protein
MKNVFVGNMNFQTTESELRALFEPFGQVTRVHIAMDRETGRARGFAFVEMPNDAEATKAMSGLDGKEVGGRALKVNEARPKAAGGGGGGGPRGGSGGTGSGGGGGFDRGGDRDRDRDRNRGGTGGRGGGKGGRFSTEDYRDSPRQPREPRW